MKSKTPVVESKLLNTKKITPDQLKLVREIMKWAKTPFLHRNALIEAHGVLRGKSSSPYFISKNRAAKTKDRGIYDLSVFTKFADAKTAKGKSAKEKVVA